MLTTQPEKSFSPAPTAFANRPEARLRRATLETLERRVLMAAGDPDATFGQAGVAAGNFGGTAAVFTDIAVLSDGKILAAGTRSQGADGAASDFLVARYNADGSPDTSFGGGDGFVLTDFGGRDMGDDLALLDGGKFVVAGVSATDTARFAVARYNADGSPDASFGGGGTGTTLVQETANA